MNGNALVATVPAWRARNVVRVHAFAALTRRPRPSRGAGSDDNGPATLRCASSVQPRRNPDKRPNSFCHEALVTQLSRALPDQ
jgi:hypothetical protein